MLWPYMYVLMLCVCLKVSGELLDKVREVEGRLQTHTAVQDERRLASYGQFQERMSRLGGWVNISSQSLSDVTPAERQVRRSQPTRCISVELH